MNWAEFFTTRRHAARPENAFKPETQEEAKKALELGLIDLRQYVEFSLSTEPVMDKIHDPDPEVRREAIRAMAERRDAFSQEVLRQLLLDEEEEVRLSAALELDRLENEINRKIYELRRRLAYDPRDPRVKLALAGAHLDFAQLIQANAVLASFLIKQALGYLDEIATLCHADENYHFMRGRALQLRGDLSAAQACYQQCLRLAPAHEAAQNLLAEVLFQRHDFDALRRLLASLPAGGRESETAQAREFWREF